MKIEHVEIPMTDVLNYFQKDFKSKRGERIKSFGKPLVDAVQGIVVFKLYLENTEDWNREFTQTKNTLAAEQRRINKKKGQK